MSMDQELLKAGIEVIRELSQARGVELPCSSHRMIATQMLKEDKLGDYPWCNQKLSSEEARIREKIRLAKKKGFYPFVNVGIGACRWIRKNYGPWTLGLMKDRLENPFDAYKTWAIRFAATMKEIGYEECKQASNLYQLVVNHPSWKEMRRETKAWAEYVRGFKETKADKVSLN